MRRFQSWLDSKIGEVKLLQARGQDLASELDGLMKEIDSHVEARAVMTEAARRTQSHFVEVVQELVTLALRAVYRDRDFRFVVDFMIRRNQSECFLRIQEGEDEPFFPEQELGGGTLDVSAIALRIVLWSLENPRSRNVLILDEPFRFMGALTREAGEMLRELSKRLGIQVILATHSDDLWGDKTWNVLFDGTKSRVVEVASEPLGVSPGSLVGDDPSVKLKRRSGK